MATDHSQGLVNSMPADSSNEVIYLVGVKDDLEGVVGQKMKKCLRGAVFARNTNTQRTGIESKLQIVTPEEFESMSVNSGDGVCVLTSQKLLKPVLDRVMAKVDKNALVFARVEEAHWIDTRDNEYLRFPKGPSLAARGEMSGGTNEVSAALVERMQDKRKEGLAEMARKDELKRQERALAAARLDLNTGSVSVVIVDWLNVKFEILRKIEQAVEGIRLETKTPMKPNVKRTGGVNLSSWLEVWGDKIDEAQLVLFPAMSDAVADFSTNEAAYAAYEKIERRCGSRFRLIPLFLSDVQAGNPVLQEDEFKWIKRYLESAVRVAEKERDAEQAAEKFRSAEAPRR